VELATKAAVALNCAIAPEVRYDRKNYFYPDTPKNYQITQYKVRGKISSLIIANSYRAL
jgi:Asp-tRNA(Asn)/Glu-tRNA(Gln) amidotransferase B subunit